MAIVRCEECQELIDDDHNPCEEHPKMLGLICPDCLCDLQDEMEEEINGEDYRKPRVPFARGQTFTKEQQAIIKQAEGIEP